MTTKNIKPKPIVLGLIAALLVLIVSGWIISTYDGMGYMKDEGYYFSASKDNFGWYKAFVNNTLDGKPFETFKQNQVDRYWQNNHEHPPFCKTVQGFNHMLWYDWLGMMNFGNSHRMSTLTFVSIMIVLMFLLVVEWINIKSAILAVLLLFTIPRMFFHTHLNTFDIPVVAMWFIIAYTFRKGMVSHKWSWITGVLLGVGLATKNNAYFLPVLFAACYLYSDYRVDFFRSIRNIPKSIMKAKKWKLLLGIMLFAMPGIVALIDFSYLAFAVLMFMVLVNLYIAFQYLRPNPWLPKFLAPIFPAMFTSPLVFTALWPWIWHDTWTRLDHYFYRHLHPPAWETYYLHNIVMNPPPFDWHYPFVMSWYTIPAAVIFVALSGIVLLLLRGRIADSIRKMSNLAKGDDAANMQPLMNNWQPEGERKIIGGKWDQFFLFMNIVIPFLIIANPKTPIYGGTKHYMTAMPFIAITCALMINYIVEKIGEKYSLDDIKRTVFTGVLGVVLAISGLIGIKHTHPNCLSYYNEIMGGTIAAAEVGMQRTFWAASTPGVFDYLNENAPKNARIHWNNTPWDSQNAYKKDGMLRKDIGTSWRDVNADYAVMNHWKFYIDPIYKIRRAFKAEYPVAWVDINGLPLTVLYRNNKKLGPEKTKAEQIKPEVKKVEIKK